MKVNISEIKIGERCREEMGDLQGLADSISQYGLLHPVVIDDQKRLVAGGRRLEACKLLGWQMIEATILEGFSEKQLQEIRLKELLSLNYKPLKTTEKSRAITELASLIKEKLKNGN